MVDLTGRVAVVTGGGRGIGRAHCLELARRGASVVVNDPGVGDEGRGTDALPAEQVVAEIRRDGGAAVSDHGSVASAGGCVGLISHAVSEFGRVDIVVNNAGILRQGPLIDLSEDAFDAVIAVHLRGTFLMTREVGRHWDDTDSTASGSSRRIINTTSSVGMVGGIGAAAYATAKAGILGLTLTTAKEFAKYGATCNAISPVAATRMTSGIFPEIIDGYSPYDPRNAAPVVSYLASESAQWLTGQVIRVQGNSVSRLTPWAMGEVYSASTADSYLDADELDLPLRQMFGVYPRDVFSVSGL